LIGYFLFAEQPRLSTVVAGALIVCGNLTLLYIENRRTRAATQVKTS
jgi:hypothetical protein